MDSAIYNLLPFKIVNGKIQFQEDIDMNNKSIINITDGIDNTSLVSRKWVTDNLYNRTRTIQGYINKGDKFVTFGYNNKTFIDNDYTIDNIKFYKNEETYNVFIIITHTEDINTTTTSRSQTIESGRNKSFTITIPDHEKKVLVSFG